MYVFCDSRQIQLFVAVVRMDKTNTYRHLPCRSWLTSSSCRQSGIFYIPKYIPRILKTNLAFSIASSSIIVYILNKNNDDNFVNLLSSSYRQTKGKTKSYPDFSESYSGYNISPSLKLNFIKHPFQWLYTLKQ